MRRCTSVTLLLIRVLTCGSRLTPVLRLCNYSVPAAAHNQTALGIGSQYVLRALAHTITLTVCHRGLAGRARCAPHAVKTMRSR